MKTKNPENSLPYSIHKKQTVIHHAVLQVQAAAHMEFPN